MQHCWDCRHSFWEQPRQARLPKVHQVWCPRSHQLRQPELCLHSYKSFTRARRKHKLWAKPSGLDAATSTLRQQVLDPKAGLPKVKQRLDFNELLRDIRLNKIDRVEYIDNAQYSDNWYKDPKSWNLIDGSCLVIYRDGHVAYSCIPPSDIRLGLAMETHGVSAVRMTPPMPSGLLSKLQTPQIPSQYLVAFFTALPVMAIVITYLATQLQAHLKGDREDRIKMRQQAQRVKREARMQAQADKLALLPREMAGMGLDEDAICRELDKLQLPYQRPYIRRLIAEEKEGLRPRGTDVGDKLAEEPDAGPTPSPDNLNVNEAEQRAAFEAAKQAESMKTGDEAQDAAADLLKMRSARIIKAATLDPEEEEMRAKTRAAMRRMKGVKLQISDERITFDDVAGIGEAKIELVEVVDFFARPELFRRSGARVPRGVLLCGPPGTGKTLLARAVAGEARVTFLSLNASEFVEMFAGVGAARVRDLFAQARSMAPAIIFIDEIDAVGRVRGGEMGNDERDQTLNQMLTEMDGFSGRDSKADVIVMAATNRKDVLDPALIRPGRFDRIITVPVPDVDGRAEILNVHLGYRPHDEANVDVRSIAFETQGFPGAQLGSLVNTAASLAGKAGRECILQRDLQEALEDEKLGPRKPGVQSYERRKRLAVQEAATALACTLMPSIEPVELVTIVPREKFPLGQTIVQVNEQREATKQFTRRYLEEQIITALAGRAAEELIYGIEEMSTLNQRRLANARELATRLVVASAMGDSAMLRPRSNPIPSGSSVQQAVPPRVTSDSPAPADDEMHVLLNGGYAETLQLLARNRKALDALIEALLQDSGPGESSGAGADPAEVFSDRYKDGTSSTVVPQEGGTLSGDEVRRIVLELGDREYLDVLEAQQAEFL